MRVSGVGVFGVRVRTALTSGLGGRVYRGTSLLRKRTPLGPYRKPIPRVLGGSWGGGRFLMDEVPLYWNATGYTIHHRVSRVLPTFLRKKPRLSLRLTLRLRVCIGFRVSGSGLRVSGSGFRV